MKFPTEWENKKMFQTTNQVGKWWTNIKTISTMCVKCGKWWKKNQPLCMYVCFTCNKDDETWWELELSSKWRLFVEMCRSPYITNKNCHCDHKRDGKKRPRWQPMEHRRFVDLLETHRRNLRSVYGWNHLSKSSSFPNGSRFISMGWRLRENLNRTP